MGWLNREIRHISHERAGNSSFGLMTRGRYLLDSVLYGRFPGWKSFSKFLEKKRIDKAIRKGSSRFR